MSTLLILYTRIQVLYTYIVIILHVHVPANHQHTDTHTRVSETSPGDHPPTTAWQPRIREAEYPPALVRQRDEALVAGQEEGRRVRAGTHARVQLHRRALGHHAVKAHDLTHVAFGASAIIERDGRDVDVYTTDLLYCYVLYCVAKRPDNMLQMIQQNIN